ncbi:MAG: DNA polymerase III subunit delta, partial [Muribaculaceae bacterium]|nr:DNA polymerase III subunit delta [Muribaculaceae bacterium]
MAKQTQSPYNSILADIRKKKFAPIYILMGEEAYFIDELTNALQELVIPEDERDFNQTILYGADATMEMVTNTARQFPVMA